MLVHLMTSFINISARYIRHVLWHKKGKRALVEVPVVNMYQQQYKHRCAHIAYLVGEFSRPHVMKELIAGQIFLYRETFESKWAVVLTCRQTVKVRHESWLHAALLVPLDCWPNRYLGHFTWICVDEFVSMPGHRWMSNVCFIRKERNSSKTD